MTALDITYEDGLRLAELTGRMNGLEYEASHMLTTHIAELALSAVLGIAVACLAWLVLYMASDYYYGQYDSTKPQRRRMRMLGKALFIAFPVIAVILGWVCVNASVDLQMVEVQGQMDAILSRCGGVA